MNPVDQIRKIHLGGKGRNSGFTFKAILVDLALEQHIY